MDDGVPAGWYPDPDGKPSQRFWDGSDWTEQTRPLLPPTSSSDSTSDASHRRKSKVLIPIVVGLALALIATLGIVLTVRQDGPERDDYRRAIAAALPECSAWQDSPPGAEVVPGVVPEWGFGCASVAAVFSFASKADICDYWSRLGDGPERIAASRDAVVLAFDLSGTNTDRLDEIAQESPDMFTVTTPMVYCRHGT